MWELFVALLTGLIAGVFSAMPRHGRWRHFDVPTLLWALLVSFAVTLGVYLAIVAFRFLWHIGHRPDDEWRGKNAKGTAPSLAKALGRARFRWTDDEPETVFMDKYLLAARDAHYRTFDIAQWGPSGINDAENRKRADSLSEQLRLWRRLSFIDLAPDNASGFDEHAPQWCGVPRWQRRRWQWSVEAHAVALLVAERYSADCRAIHETLAGYPMVGPQGPGTADAIVMHLQPLFASRKPIPKSALTARLTMYSPPAMLTLEHIDNVMRVLPLYGLAVDLGDGHIAATRHGVNLLGDARAKAMNQVYEWRRERSV